MKKNSFETQILHTPFEKEDAYHSLSMPVYHTAAYEFETAEEMEAAFCGQKAGHAYSRITNPTVQYFEQRVQRVTGALSVFLPFFQIFVSGSASLYRLSAAFLLFSL